MRILHNLWRVSNGWLLVPEGTNSILDTKQASECSVFKSLDEFAKSYPRRERKRKVKATSTTTKETTHAN